ncbi:GT-D fold domain-containing glycosyltransferase [Leucobacter sp. HY1910]
MMVDDELSKLLNLAEKQAETQAQILDIHRKILWEATANRRNQDVIRLAQSAPILDDVSRFAEERQLSFGDTLRVIRDEGLSFARFGDGELKLMLRSDYKLKFQSNSPLVSNSLRDVLESPAEGLLLGFPHVFRDLHWSNVWCDLWGQLSPLVSKHERYGNSHVSRPIFFELTGQEGVEAWREIWSGQRVTIITGKGSRFNLMPELFDNCTVGPAIESLPVNAISDVDRIVDIANQDKADLFLVSLGAAGTVVANRIAKRGRRAIDIGHISDSYENIFLGGAWPEHKSVTKV